LSFLMYMMFGNEKETHFFGALMYVYLCIEISSRILKLHFFLSLFLQGNL
jgi:hypothetical protein